MKKLNEEYFLSCDLSGGVYNVIITFLDNELICYEGDILNGEYSVTFKLKSQTIDNDILEQCNGIKEKSILSQLKRELFIEFQYRHEIDIQTFLFSIKDSVFYKSGLFLGVKNGDNNIENINEIIDFCTAHKYRSTIRKHIISFETCRDEFINDEEDIVEYLATNSVGFIDNLNRKNRENVGELFLKNLNYDSLWKYVLAPSSNSSFIKTFLYKLVYLSGHLSVFSLLMIVYAFALYLKGEQLFAPKTFWTPVLLYGSFYFVFYLCIGHIVDRKNVLLAKYTFFSNLNVFILVGWIALLPLSNDLWVNDLSFEYTPGFTIISFVLLSFIIALFYSLKLKRLKPSTTLKIRNKKLVHQLSLGLPMTLITGTVFLQLSFPSVMFEQNFYSCQTIQGIELASQISQLKKSKKAKSKLITNDFLDSLSTFAITDTSYIKEKKEDLFSLISNRDLKELTKYSINKDTIAMEKLTTSLKIENNIKLDAHFTLLIKEYSKCQSESKNALRRMFPTVLVIEPFSLFTIYIFPGLLIFGGLLAFVVGYFIQYIAT